ncbi:ATP-binding protein [Streptomyces sp. NBC_00996]|uniref:ATP-binding protein n=1 Tax=Streptomyces sp. NBC_00996 TaxID=2903710 RepID=UPI0038640770|nr:ATP-binding protein [Streptomyces sp. NBC_00996]
MPEYTLRCPTLETSPRIARDFVASVLRAQRLGALVDDATVCVSELVTNSCVHAKGTDAVLRLATGPAVVRVTVYDEDRTPPAPSEGYDAESGRGLWIVEALTEGRWGTEPGTRLGLTGEGGKGVWFELDAAATWKTRP